MENLDANDRNLDVFYYYIFNNNNILLISIGSQGKTVNWRSLNLYILCIGYSDCHTTVMSLSQTGLNTGTK